MTNFKDAKGIHASGAPADPFRYRGRKTPKLQTPKQRAKIQWMLDDFESYHAALLRKLSLGSLPKRGAKYGCADFDLEDQTEYCGDDGTKAKGHNLAGIAAYIVRSAKDPIDYLFSLKKLPAMVIEPIRAYLRVKLAMGRLKAEIETVSKTLEETSNTVIPAAAKRRVSVCSANTETSRGQYSGENNKRSAVCHNIIENGPDYLNQLLCSDEVPAQGRDDSGGVVETSPSSSPQRKPTFKWHTSPSKVYGFKEMRITYGYDPRDTSVYWIEKRANALRRKWKRHGQALRGEPRHRSPSTLHKSMEPRNRRINTEPETRYFQPADADYNSVWPPVDMPAAPKTEPKPKPKPNAKIIGPASPQARNFALCAEKLTPASPRSYPATVTLTHNINSQRGATMSVKSILLSAAFIGASLSLAAPVQAQSENYIGQIILVGYNFCPRGTVEANGALLRISSHTALFSLYGTNFGGDGRTTFGMPDLRGRTIIGNGTGKGLTPRGLGQRGGTEETTALSLKAAKGEDINAANKDFMGTNMQPFLVLRYCVVTEGMYPSRN